MKKKYLKNRDRTTIIRNSDGLIISNACVTRDAIKFHYDQKFFNKFLNKFEFTGISYQQKAYILRKFWDESAGTIGAFIRKDWVEGMREDERIVFAPWVLFGRINIYNFPNQLTFVNTKGVSYIPVTPFTIDEDAVIGYIQRNHKGVYSSIRVKIEQLVDIEMTIRTNLKTQKTPWILGVAPEDKEKMKDVMEQVEADEPLITIGLKEMNSAKALVSGAPYILDKLYTLKQSIENEILTIIGINNIGVMEKKEHLLDGEIEENNEQIENSSNEYISCLEEFCERIRTSLGFNISVKDKMAVKEEIDTESKEDEEDE